MVANWDILNKEFNEIIDNISDEQWNDWYSHLETQKKRKKLELLIRAKIQASRIANSKASNQQIFNDTIFSGLSMGSEIDTYTSDLIAPCKSPKLPLAA